MILAFLGELWDSIEYCLDEGLLGDKVFRNKELNVGATIRFGAPGELLDRFADCGTVGCLNRCGSGVVIDFRLMPFEQFTCDGGLRLVILSRMGPSGPHTT